MIGRLAFTILIFLALAGCRDHSPVASADPGKDRFAAGQAYYLAHIKEAQAYLDTLALYPSTSPMARDYFARVRLAFKKAEPYASYLNPAIGHRTNGPALPIFKEDSGKELLPIGLQKLEETIFEGGVSELIYQREIEITKGLIKNLAGYIAQKELTAPRFFIATHQQLLRIISLGISGFDTPVSHLGLRESQISLQSLWEVYGLTIQPIILEREAGLDDHLQQQIRVAMEYLEGHDDFASFDRFTFIRDFMNPLTRTWVAIRKASGLWAGTEQYPFNFDAPTFFDPQAFNVAYFASQKDRDPSEALTALGEKLFFDPALSSGGRLACASCHIPEMAYADGRVASLDNRGMPLKRNTPSLINTVFQQAYFWDGRSGTLSDQITSVFLNEQEFDTEVHRFSNEILRDSSYTDFFMDAFGRMPGRNLELVSALSAYLGTLNAFNSRFDRNIRGEEDTLTEEEKLGFNLYMGKALCATCHFIPLTNGSVPPFYKETEKEVIGVPNAADNAELDEDTGFFWVYGSELHRGMFKTPTVRNAALTAPYMHNGVYWTLEEVVHFYNVGGGAGLGFPLAHQTLPFDELHLSLEEEHALVAFLKTLSDPNIAGD